MEFVFGIRENKCIRFEVLGPTCPNAEENWYRAQLDVEIHAIVGTFRGYRSLVMFSDDFHLFRAALTRLSSGDAASAWLQTGDYLSVQVSAEGGAYNVWVQLEALEQDGEELLCEGGAENWEWRLATDRASLDSLLAEVTRVSERYPTWSVSRS